MQKLYLTIGILGSGKTTWAKKMAKEDSNVKIISPDVIRQMLHGRYLYDNDLDSLVTNICQELIKILSYNYYDVIIDCCNLTKSRRESWPWWRAEKIAVVFPRKTKVWHVNNKMKDSKGKSRSYWNGVYDSHVEQVEPIDKESFNEVIYVGEEPENTKSRSS